MLRIIVLAVVVVAALGGPLLGGKEDYMEHGLPKWAEFKSKHGKEYETQEEDVHRQGIYESNLVVIMKHNYPLNKHTYKLGANEYADWTSEEFVHFMNGFNSTKAKKILTGATLHKADDAALPASVDWRTKGYVTMIKNQKQCGSCWAFSATGSLEGQHFMAKNDLVSLSEQNLVDCSRPQGNMGCQGGLMDQAFEYIKVNGGIDTEESYPYTAMNGQCMFNPANVGAMDTGFVDVMSGSEMMLKDAVANIGPISVAMDASQPSFQLYESGVYQDSMCSSTQLDHGVLAIGYGTMGTQDFWLVKNSWGTTWGMEGFFMMARNMNNMCGIATSASYPTV